MKRYISIFLLLIFLLPINLGSKQVYANENKTIVLNYNDQQFIFNEEDLGCEGDKTPLTNQQLLQKLSLMGFNYEQILNYVYPKISSKFDEIANTINKNPINSTVDVTTGQAVITPHQIGEEVDKKQLYLDLYHGLISGVSQINVEVQVKKLYPVLKEEDNLNLTHEKSSFITYINGSNQEGRIHNIKQALQRFNGRMIAPNEKVSFNEIIGDTTEENGYKKAKVILNGKYVDDFGGGVCQAATTLYNSALIAGLKIKQVRPHSLKVGYVKGSFDAMVSAGISDLIIENPYTEPVFLHTYATNSECGVKIFGTTNEYLIERRCERKELSVEESEKYSYISEGYLDYFKDGELVKSQKIRSDKYYKVKLDETTESSALLSLENLSA